MSGETEQNVSGWTTDTLRTLVQVEVARVQELVQAHVEAMANLRDSELAIRDQRLDDMNKATEILSQTINRTPTVVQTEIKHVRELMDEKFHSVDQQFHERDVRTDQQAGASSQALAAALQAAKELVGAQGEASAAAAVKSETSFTKQIDQIGTIIQTLEKSLDARITELKERIDRGEGSSSGIRDSTSDRRQGSALAYQMAALVISAVVLVIGLYATFHK